MNDMRDALRRAGLVSQKQARQAKHKERLHKTEVGREGLDQERSDRDKESREKIAAKRSHDRELEAERRDREPATAPVDPKRLIANGVVHGAVGGNKKYFFVVDGGRITFLEVSGLGLQRLQSGTAAIANTLGAVRGEFCIVDRETAEAVEPLESGVIVYRNREGNRVESRDRTRG